MNRKTPNQDLGIAACAISVTASGEIQLLPAGEFRAIDGRPKDVPGWVIDAQIAASVISAFNLKKNDTVIDYEHQTILSAQNGQPAPASGWFSQLEWRDDGLWAVDVRWTERASARISDKEYKYISPVFAYDKRTGAVKGLLHAALTNNPALDDMHAVAASQFAQLINQSQKESLSMDGILEQLRWMLNLPVTSSQDEVIAELQKAIDQIKAAQPTAAASADFNVVALIKSQADQIAALTASASNPDPSKFVPVATMQTLQNEFAALRAQITEREVNEVVTAALASGKILPAQEAWARGHGKENLASLKAYLEGAQPIAALTATQTGGIPPEGSTTVQLDENQLAVCRATGTAPEDFMKTLQATQAQA